MEKQSDLAIDENLDEQFPSGVQGRVLFWIAVLFSLFQVVTASHIIDLPSMMVRAIHVGFLIFLALPLHALMKGNRSFLAWGLAFLGAIVAGYQCVEYVPLMMRAGDPNTADLIIGVMSLFLVFLSAWVMMGPALPIIAGAFLAYCFFGQYLPSPLNHRGYDFSQVIDHMAFGTEGIYGIPIYVSSTYIFLFILFGAFLEKAGMIRLFTDISLGLVGNRMGGAAKVSVISSALMGTISGSGVANVVTTGQFTIPLMKRFGYRPAFAGGVEAASSMGGQIMPPVMGAVAFIMAETIGVDYIEVVRAAVIPAILYFSAIFLMVHLEAGRLSLRGLAKSELPSPLQALKTGWYLLLPLAALVWLLFSGFTPLYAGTIGLGLTMLLILGSPIANEIKAKALRYVFWIALGLVAAFFRFGIMVLVGAIVLLLLLDILSQGGRSTLLLVRDALADGARSALPVGVACALVGVIIGTMTLTGIANTFGQFIVGIGEKSLLLSLILTMITCLILGMGIPTIPNYIITASIAGPALATLGVPLIVSHMFVFYFGILADLTPPVALACFAAAPIAKEKGLNISMQAVKISAAGFVIPFIAVYSPALMLQNSTSEAGFEFWILVLFIFIKAALAIGLWGAAIIGWLGSTLQIWQRVLAFIAALFLFVELPIMDAIGFILTASFAISVFIQTRRAA